MAFFSRGVPAGILSSSPLGPDARIQRQASEDEPLPRNPPKPPPKGPKAALRRHMRWKTVCGRRGSSTSKVTSRSAAGFSTLRGGLKVVYIYKWIGRAPVTSKFCKSTTVQVCQDEQAAPAPARKVPGRPLDQ